MHKREVQLSIPFDRDVIERIHAGAGTKMESARGRGRPIKAPFLEKLQNEDLSVVPNISQDINLDSPWTDREKGAWAPPKELKVSEWAERHRMLPSKTSASPGQWSNVPYYTVDVMDAFVDPWVETITIMASVQSSKTESVYNMLGFAICEDPAPALVVMPTIGLMKRANKKILSMIRESEEMAQHITSNPDDLTKQELQLDNLCITFATAGSTADLRNVEVRYCLMDETDDYPMEVSDQGSPIEMAEARTTTFWNRKIIHVCTPTTDDGYIAREYGRSDQSKYWVPCPYCKGYQKLSMSRIKHLGEKLGEWPRDRRGFDYIRLNRVARYECEHCGAEIDDRDKRWMLRFGTWIPEGHSIEKDGSVAIPMPRSIHRGFQWSSLISPWRSFSDVAAQFFKTKDDPETYKTFVNLWLGEPWKQEEKKRETSEILQLKSSRGELVCPPNTIAITLGADNQKYGKWVVVRAWQRMEGTIESHLIRYGFLETWEDLERWIFQDVYTVEGSGIQLPVWRAAIDIGGTMADDREYEDETMTEQVYDWLRAHGQEVVFGVKGSSRNLTSGKRMTLSIIDKMPRSKRPIPGGIKLWLLDTGRIKDALWSRIETGKFHLHAQTDESYAKQITAEAKVKDKTGRFVWKCQSNRPNHYFDAEVYAAAMADPECDGGVMVLRVPSDPSVVNKGRESPDHTVMRSTRQNLSHRTINPYAAGRKM